MNQGQPPVVSQDPLSGVRNDEPPVVSRGQPPVVSRDPLSGPGPGLRQPPGGAKDSASPEGALEVLSSRVLLRPLDLDRTVAFYREGLGLAVYREFGDGADRGIVFFLGGGFLEVSGRSREPAGQSFALWLQVRDLAATERELTARGVLIARAPRREPWGLYEMWVTDPDGVRIHLVEVPPEHPLRRG